jgi:hypothetical protein
VPVFDARIGKRTRRNDRENLRDHLYRADMLGAHDLRGAVGNVDVLRRKIHGETARKKSQEAPRPRMKALTPSFVTGGSCGCWNDRCRSRRHQARL